MAASSGLGEEALAGEVVGERGEFGGVAAEALHLVHGKDDAAVRGVGLTSRAVRAPPRTGSSADAGADLLAEDLVPRDAVARKASSWASSSCPRAEQGARVVPSPTPASAPVPVTVTDSWQGEPSTVRARVELVHGQRRTRRAWRHGEGQSGPAHLDDLWGGVSSQPCVSWRRARRTSLDVGRCPTCRVVSAVGCGQQLCSRSSAEHAARRRECLVAYSALTGRVTPSWLPSRWLRLRT